MRRREAFAGLAENRAELAHPTMWVEILRRFVRRRVHRAVVGIARHNQGIDIGVEMQVPDDRRQNLQDIGPTPGAIPRRRHRRLFFQSSLDQDPQYRLVRRRLAEERYLHDSSGTPPRIPLNHISPSEPSLSSSATSARSANRSKCAS